MKKGIIEFSEELMESILEGTSSSNVIDTLQKQFKPLTFEEACEPLIKWLSENKHPHCVVIVDCSKAELLEGLQTHINSSFIQD